MTPKTKAILEMLIERICDYEREKTAYKRGELREACWLSLEDVLQSIRDADRAQSLSEPSGQTRVGDQKPEVLP